MDINDIKVNSATDTIVEDDVMTPFFDRTVRAVTELLKKEIDAGKAQGIPFEVAYATAIYAAAANIGTMLVAQEKVGRLHPDSLAQLKKGVVAIVQSPTSVSSFPCPIGVRKVPGVTH